jgi:nucleoid DNA-binding protein
MSSKSKAGRAKAPPKPKARAKGEIQALVAGKAGLSKAQAGDALAALAEVVAAELKAGRPVVLAGMVKVVIALKAATPARPGRNPSTGEPLTISAKPARRVVRVRPLKTLRDMA